MAKEKSAQPAAHLYVRVSTHEQADAGNGAAAQRAALDAYFDQTLARKGLQKIGPYQDLGVSGKERFRDRPAGTVLWSRLRPGDALVVAKMDRAFRSAVDALVTHQELEKLGATLVVTESGIDGTTPTGKMMLGLLAVFAEFERSLISQRTKAAMAVRKTLGLAPPGRLAPGQKNVGPVGQRRRVFDADDPDLVILRWMLEQKDRGFGYLQIAAFLRDQGVRRRDKGFWDYYQVRRAVMRMMKDRAARAKGGST